MEQSSRVLLNQPVLLLNRYCSPVTVTTARRALILLYGGSGRALDERGETYEFSDWRQLPVRNDDEALPIVNGALRIPRVL
ncbi:MAG TPA: HNH endonuclease, partial [Polyangiaceae bacterium]|nr:HNH endonuclease [Polyangiaceae bacterium]